ncbi:MAG: NAD(P)H-dependent oxidoreductase subunit E [Candidatus Cyclonatronum sp.]|uniref:NAD(P)H-dependent oxidoreductase subunit E n=1 Tax=Cyclonatronum sp. TaxID=3024185 RepID=UPI0025BF483D|nr:NAD(P)H-dependent oxidoreductase subunit E [Cyclonatronum sp.]MCC5932968.1 NAD(P)H-dependent oxidoreductase subunit E [Balneolales bacterium]MCH8485315.1 NAD(P)H-dependent oxidoreductase subunit E [Cyclonatronum sp.]
MVQQGTILHNTGFAEPARTRMLDRLWEIQNRQRFISDTDIRRLAGEFSISAIEVEGVVSFYHFFHRKHAGKFTIYVNDSMTSRISGYDRIIRAFERETGARHGTTDATETFGLYATPCIGLCDQEPAALINFHPFTRLNALRIREIIAALKKGAPVETLCDEPAAPIRYTAGERPGIFFTAFTPGDAVSKLKTNSPDTIIGALKTTKLAGRGGAFYPTWMKWQAAADQPTGNKVVICNADEGEPGTFKDRILLQKVPETVIEGMTACARAIGANFGLIYLRAEYQWLQKPLLELLERYRNKKLLGRDCCGLKDFHFDIRLQIGAGSYVCGEETALIESAEGKRGEPRTKWFFPVQRGYLQLPTVVNNVETFSAAARILQHGVENYQSYGIERSSGTKLISVSGDCRKPGIYEINWGTTLRQLLSLCEAEHPWYIQESGPSGTVLSLDDLDVPIAMFDSMLTQHIRCGGALTIFSKNRDIIEILLNYADFYKKESCGICTPCRAGNFIVERKLERIRDGLATNEDLDELRQWGRLMRMTSRCGLGKTATNSIETALKKFAYYFESHTDPADKRLNMKFDLEGATADYEAYKS